MNGESARLPASPKGLGQLFPQAQSVTTGQLGQALVALVSQIHHWEHRVLGFFERPSSGMALAFDLEQVTLIKWMPLGSPEDEKEESPNSIEDFLKVRTIPTNGKVKFAVTIRLPKAPPALAASFPGPMPAPAPAVTPAPAPATPPVPATTPASPTSTAPAANSQEPWKLFLYNSVTGKIYHFILHAVNIGTASNVWKLWVSRESISVLWVVPNCPKHWSMAPVNSS